MLKKMRRRVILAAMLAFSAVILLIAVLVNIVNYCVVTSRADQTLQAILSFETRAFENPENGERNDIPGAPKEPGEPPRQPFMALPDVEDNYMTRFFTVRFNAKQEAVFASTDYIAAIDEEAAIGYATRVLEKGRERGYVKAYRYMVKEAGSGTVVVFLNTTREQSSMRTLLVLTFAISFGSLLIVFVLVALFSRRAIRPIANNIRQQKQFITDASHELKTPLTSISTSVDVLSMEHGEDEWTENIKKQTERMTKLVSELVTLSRLDEDRPLPDKEQFSLSDVAWEIADVYSPQAKAKGKQLSVEIEDNLSLLGDKAAVMQMLSVLLDNAIRYSDENGEIRFSVYKKRGKIRMDCFNTCHYDEPPDTERLFDRFYRPDSSRNTATGGSGVGLSIAKAVAQSHGGKITASCPSGETMTIRIVF